MAAPARTTLESDARLWLLLSSGERHQLNQVNIIDAKPAASLLARHLIEHVAPQRVRPTALGRRALAAGRDAAALAAAGLFEASRRALLRLERDGRASTHYATLRLLQGLALIVRRGSRDWALTARGERVCDTLRVWGGK